MKITKRTWMCLALLLVLAGTALVQFDPQIQAEKFVGRWGNRVEAGLAAGTGVPAGAGDHMANEYMIEFTLTSRGFGSRTSYYGCYYSHRDVPLAFQFADVPLVPRPDGSWAWQAEGDNHGTTEKIRDHWYYFEAHF